MDIDEMKSMAERAVRESLSRGAETSEVTIIENNEFGTSVRKGIIETLSESVSSLLSITLSLDKRKASVTSSDLSEGMVSQLITEAIELAGVMDRDVHFDLPAVEELGAAGQGLEVYDADTVAVPTKDKIDTAAKLEKKACSMDSRIISDGGSFSNGLHRIAFANSLGFCEGYSSTFAAIGVSCAAEDSPGKGRNIGKKQSSFWYSAAASLRALESVDEIASKAVSRTLRKLGAVKPRTCEIPAIFDAVTARSFLGSVAAASEGGNIYRKASFLVDRIGDMVGSANVTILDDALLRGKLGSRPFDEEGVRSRCNVVFEKGMLKNYLMNSYQARKLGLETTGSAGGFSNFYMQPGTCTEEEMISSIGEGLYLTSLSGPGANWTTGDFSQGAQGIWIERGELSHPVDEFTIAGTFPQMLMGIVMVGREIDWNRPVASPAFKIDGMTISGT